MATLPSPAIRRQFTDSELSALAHYSQTGNVSASAAFANIPRQRFRSLLNRPDVKQSLCQFRDAVRINLGSKLYAITAESADKALEVLRKGEEKIDVQTGERYRQEPSLRDLAYTAGTFSRLFNDQVSAIEQGELTASLVTLADRLAALGTGAGQPPALESRPGGANNKEEKVVARPSSDCNEFSKLDLLLNGGAEHG